MVLVIQFREDATEAHEQECISRHLPDGQQIRFLSIFDTYAPFKNPKELLQGVTKLIIGGSAKYAISGNASQADQKKLAYILETVKPVVQYVLRQDFPTLGVCYGHQLLAHFSGTTVVSDGDQAETGVFEITLTPEGENDPLFKDVPQRFYAVEGHKNSLLSIPADATLLARSERCIAQALRYGNNVYSTQFHSELNAKDLAYRVSLFPGYSQGATDLSMQTQPSPFSTEPLKAFLAL